MKTIAIALLFGLLGAGCASGFTSVGKSLVVHKAAREHNCPTWKVRVLKANEGIDPVNTTWVLDVCGRKIPYRLRAIEAAKAPVVVSLFSNAG